MSSLVDSTLVSIDQKPDPVIEEQGAVGAATPRPHSPGSGEEIHKGPLDEEGDRNLEY